MRDGIELEQTCGACPEQYEGTVDGNPAYFRLRHSHWTFCIVKPGESPSGPKNPDNVLYFKDGEYRRGQDCGVMEDALGLIDSMIEEFRNPKHANATLAEDIYSLRLENAALKLQIERLKNAPCRHDQEALDRARDDSGYF